MGMVDTATDSKSFLDADRVALPLWYMILVGLGSAGVGGYFGAWFGIWGVVFSAVGGLGAAVFWLSRVNRFQTESTSLSIFYGILWGVFVGVIDTLWLHLTAWGLGYNMAVNNEFHIGFQATLIIGLMLGAGAGAVYGLLCMVVLKVYSAIKWQGQA
jgi:hypothetical protein